MSRLGLTRAADRAEYDAPLLATHIHTSRSNRFTLLFHRASISGTEWWPVVGCMSPSPSEPTSKGIPRLTCSTVGGKSYTRHPDVEAEILRALERPRGDWGAMAEGRSEDRLSNEALVFLIRNSRNGDLDVFGRLVYELSRRTLRIAQRWAQGFDSCTTEEIVRKVDEEIVVSLLTREPCRESEFLEIAFGTAVKRRTIKIVEKHKQDALSRRALSVEISGDPAVRARVRDKGPGPQGIISELENQARRSALVRIACSALKDRRHLEAVILRHVHGWPITDKDPTVPSLARHFGKSEKQIRNWIKEALETMRAAIGDMR